MGSNKYERDFTEQAHLKRPGRVDLRLFQHTSVLGDGYGGLQYMLHKMLGGVFNKFVIEGCQYTGGAVQQGYILYEGKVVEVAGETIAVANGEWLYLDSTGDASVTTTEATAMNNCLIFMKESDGTQHDIRFRALDNVMNLYELEVNQNIEMRGDHIDLHDGNLDDVATIDGGGDAVQMDDDLDMNSKNLIKIGANDVNINSLIQAEINQLANVNSVTITNDQWGYLGASDQGIATGDTPSFTGMTLTGNLLLVANSITGTSVDINNAEMQQLSNIGSATISTDQWVYLGVMNQDIRTTDPVTFLRITSTQTTGTAPFTVASTTVVSNLNADKVDGFDLDQNVLIASSPTFTNLTITTNLSVGGTINGIDVTDHVSRHHNGGGDPLVHQNIAGAGTNTHAQVDSHIGSSSNPHTVALQQLTPGTADGNIDMGGNDLNNIQHILINRNPDNITGSGIIAIVTLGETVAIGDALYINSSGKYSKTDADSTGTMPCCAIALEIGNLDNDKKVLLWGYYRDDTLFSSFNLGNRLYISGSIGLFTNTPPSGTGDIVQSVGKLINDGSGNKVLHFVPDITEIELF